MSRPSRGPDRALSSTLPSGTPLSSNFPSSSLSVEATSIRSARSTWAPTMGWPDSSTVLPNTLVSGIDRSTVATLFRSSFTSTLR